MLLYQAYQAQLDWLWPWQAWARSAAYLLEPPAGSAADAQRRLAASYDVFAGAGLTHNRPPFAIDHVRCAGRNVAVTEEVAHRTPFCDLLHFRKDLAQDEPRVLLVAPMSGHFATLLRETVRTLLPEHDVFITDWRNARDVPLADGRFGFDDYADYLIHFLDLLGPGTHVVAVCQPCVPLLAAAALMGEDNHLAQPRSMTLIAGPIDCRIKPTQINELASHAIDWFERNLVAIVPLRYAGALRRVYPGFLQLSAFMSMNIERHAQAFADLFNHLATGARDKAEAMRTFYNEYFAVADLPAEFYLETLQRVFQEHALARGALVYRAARPIDLAAIRRSALLTVEGARDDICAPGQTHAAHALCSGLPAHLHHHCTAQDAGHYGVFSGRRWEQQIYPAVRALIRAADTRWQLRLRLAGLKQAASV